MLCKLLQNKHQLALTSAQPMNHFPYHIYGLDSYSLAYHVRERFKQIVQRDDTISCDIIEQIEDNLIPALDYIIDWEPDGAPSKL